MAAGASGSSEVAVFVRKALEQPSVQLAQLYLHCKAVSLSELPDGEGQVSSFLRIVRDEIVGQCYRLFDAIAAHNAHKVARHRVWRSSSSSPLQSAKPQSTELAAANDAVQSLFFLRCMLCSLEGIEGFQPFLGFNRLKGEVYLDQHHPGFEDCRERMASLFASSVTLVPTPKKAVCFSI